MTGVLVCEDADDMRAMLREGLEEDPALRAVGEAADGDAAVTQAGTLQPDVVLLDLATVRRTLLQVAAERPQDR